ncbi:transporter substrate-binding domain-containing protein [Actinomadura madurae]|uniref:transporter substrate-binding domain-containing protein n=1 Tax=Actinomadura madurae TaxID=1993 RepID=UPI0020D21DBD|nr:transporter substrate-binding domain-containing protein [Actinomadura madurae]
MFLLLSFGVAACATAGASIDRGEVIVVGVKADQPGLGLRKDGVFQGFEVDVGGYIARHLGASRVEFREVRSDDRERKLNDHVVDLVLASYSITPDRAKLVTFGGPYYVAHQDVMVRRGETRIRGCAISRGGRCARRAGRCRPSVW